MPVRGSVDNAAKEGLDTLCENYPGFRYLLIKLVVYVVSNLYVYT